MLAYIFSCLIIFHKDLFGLPQLLIYSYAIIFCCAVVNKVSFFVNVEMLICLEIGTE